MNKDRTTEEILESIYILVNEARKKQIHFQNTKKNEDNVIVCETRNNVKSNNNFKKNINDSLDWKKIDFSKNIIKTSNGFRYYNLIEKIFREEFSKWLFKRPKWIQSKTLDFGNEFIKDKFRNN